MFRHLKKICTQANRCCQDNKKKELAAKRKELNKLKQHTNEIDNLVQRCRHTHRAYTRRNGKCVSTPPVKTQTKNGMANAIPLKSNTYFNYKSHHLGHLPYEGCPNDVLVLLYLCCFNSL